MKDRQAVDVIVRKIDISGSRMTFSLYFSDIVDPKGIYAIDGGMISGLREILPEGIDIGVDVFFSLRSPATLEIDLSWDDDGLEAVDRAVHLAGEILDYFEGCIMDNLNKQNNE